jgi:hypothetical protein
MLEKKFQWIFRLKMGPRVRMTVYVVVDHAHDLVTRRSITVILIMLDDMPIRLISKLQKEVEISTYGSELVASRNATELILEIRRMARSLGVALDGLESMLGDNMSVVLITINNAVPSILLKKKHNAIAYHLVKDAIAARIMKLVYIKSEENVRDILTKTLNNYNL